MCNIIDVQIVVIVVIMILLQVLQVRLVTLAVAQLVVVMVGCLAQPLVPAHHVVVLAHEVAVLVVVMVSLLNFVHISVVCVAEME